MTGSVKERSPQGGHSGDTEAMEGWGNCPRPGWPLQLPSSSTSAFPHLSLPTRGSGSRAAGRRAAVVLLTLLQSVLNFTGSFPVSLSVPGLYPGPRLHCRVSLVSNPRQSHSFSFSSEDFTPPEDVLVSLYMPLSLGFSGAFG